MIFYSASQKIVYFSTGKVGTSSIARALEILPYDDWTDQAGQYPLGEFINRFKGYKLNVVIRDPYDRWVSGFKENTLGPHLYGTTPLTSLDLNPETIFNYIEFDDDCNVIEKHSHDYNNTNLEIPVYINPKYSNSEQFWKTQLNCQMSYCNYDFSMGGSVHCINWLWQVLILSRFFNVNLIYGDVLDHLRKQYGNQDIIHNKNVTDPLAITKIHKVLKESFRGEESLKDKLDRYLLPEEYLYKLLLTELIQPDDTISISTDKFTEIFNTYIENIKTSHEYIDYPELYKQEMKHKVIQVTHYYPEPELVKLFK